MKVHANVILLGVLLGVLTMAVAATGATVDLDRGSEVTTPVVPSQPTDREDCYTFGGASEFYSNPNSGRGNTYTVADDEFLSWFTMELSFTGEADLYFYVLESSTIDGTYMVAAESIVTTTGVGQAFYESGPLNLVLLPGNYYGIGVAWQDVGVTYFRDPASLPRAWDLGTVEDAMQITDPPPYTSLIYNHFIGAEYSMELCFQGTIATETVTWGVVKAFYR